MTDDLETLRELSRRNECIYSSIYNQFSTEEVTALTHIIDALSNPDEHAKVLGEMAHDWSFLESVEAAKIGALRAGALALGQQAAKDKRIVGLTEALHKIVELWDGGFIDNGTGDFCGNDAIAEARRALAGDRHE